MNFVRDISDDTPSPKITKFLLSKVSQEVEYNAVLKV